jgi:hypothetical protein
MRNIMKKLICLFLFGSIAILNADQKKEDLDPFYNPSSAIVIPESPRMNISADALYWIAQEDGLYYAQGGREKNPAYQEHTQVYDFRGNMIRITPEWEGGFRVNVGYRMPHDNWDIYASWTRYAIRTQNDIQDYCVCLWGHSNEHSNGDKASNGASYAKGVWDLTYDVITLQWGRAFYAGKYFSMRPFFGVKGALIPQYLEVYYSFWGEDVATSSNKIKTDFYGAGPYSGLDFIFDFNDQFGIYANASIAFLFGCFDTSYYTLEDTTNFVHSKDDFSDSIATSNFGIGFNWGRYFNNHKNLNAYYLNVKLGWEQNIWYGINKMTHFLQRFSEGKVFKENGNLSLQGATFRVSVDF